MRVLLVQAFTALDMELVYPIGLAYLAAHLDDHDVQIFDINLYRDDPYTAPETKLTPSTRCGRALATKYQSRHTWQACR